MTQLEIASRAAAGAMGLNPATDWERGRPVAEAVLAAVAFREAAEEEILVPDIASDAFASAVMRGLTSVDNAITSPEVAQLAAKGLRDPLSLLPTEIQSVCASALVQREVGQ